jgi:hypothetical protein
VSEAGARTGRPYGVAALGIVFAVLLLHCGSDDSEGGGAPSNFGNAGASGGSAQGGSGGFGFGGAGGTVNADGGAPPPPEQEVESSFRTPVATGRYIWAANPDSGRVALINSESLDVGTTEAGFGPTYIAAVEGPDAAIANTAIVLNVGSFDATLLRATPGGEIETIATLPTHVGANAWAVSARGRWAIAWTDASQLEEPDATDGFQEITVISLAPGAESSTRLTVGYRPTKIEFDAAETRAFAVTEPGISVVALPGAGDPTVSDLVELTDDPLENPASRDVAITREGDTAIVRRDGSAEIGLVPLDGGARGAITLSGAVTDLDVTEDGSRAVAVVRERSEVAIVPIPAPGATPGAITTVTVPGETFGSVSLSADARVALLYTNAIPNDHVTILHLEAGPDFLTHRSVSVKAPVKAVFPAPDAAHAIVLMSTPPGSTKRGAFSVVPTSVPISPKVVGTDAPPTAVALSSAPSDRALITVRDDDLHIYGVYVVRMPALQVDLIPLASPPLATGVVPDTRKGYVAQRHPEGRVTFVDLADGSARTLTGFELGAEVVE